MLADSRGPWERQWQYSAHVCVGCRNEAAVWETKFLRPVCWSRGLHEASADQFRKCSLLVSLQFRFMPSRMTCISDRRLKTSPKNAPSSRCWRKVMWIFKSAKHFWSLTNNTALQHSAQQLKHKGTNCLQQSWDPTLILRDLIHTLSLSCNLHCSVMHPRLTRVPTRDCTSRA